jgi:hypothetical protein
MLGVGDGFLSGGLGDKERMLTTRRDMVRKIRTGCSSVERSSFMRAMMSTSSSVACPVGPVSPNPHE